MSSGCLVCGNAVARPKYNKYCSRKCKVDAQRVDKKPKKCLYCQKEFIYSHKNKDQVYCSVYCRHESDRKGCVGPDGYIYIGYNGKLWMQHRYVMEQHLGRPLLTSEPVHHIDGNKQNNAIENLQLLPSHADHVRVHHPRIMTETHAECLGCNEVKPFSDYYPARTKNTGMASRCKACCHTAYVERRKRHGLPTNG